MLSPARQLTFLSAALLRVLFPLVCWLVLLLVCSLCFCHQLADWRFCRQLTWLHCSLCLATSCFCWRLAGSLVTGSIVTSSPACIHLTCVLPVDYAHRTMYAHAQSASPFVHPFSSCTGANAALWYLAIRDFSFFSFK